MRCPLMNLLRLFRNCGLSLRTIHAIRLPVRTFRSECTCRLSKTLDQISASMLSAIVIGIAPEWTISKMSSS